MKTESINEVVERVTEGTGIKRVQVKLRARMVSEMDADRVFRLRPGFVWATNSKKLQVLQLEDALSLFVITTDTIASFAALLGTAARQQRFNFKEETKSTRSFRTRLHGLMTQAIELV
jgi:hypothetical protein